jgi:SulP family sulfate permease
VLVPKLLSTLRSYTWAQFGHDAAAGVIVGVVALPLAIAFGIASGVAPERGLVTAIVGGFLISALGGSRVQIGGPTGAFVVIVYGIVQRYGVDGLAVATLMAGAILVILGLARMGGAIKFIPFPVTIGFTSGIALLIFSSQLKDFLGLEMGSVPIGFLEKWRAYAAHAGSLNPWAVAVGGGALAILILWPRVSRRVPASLVALVAATLAVHALRLPVETIGDRFGEIRTALPPLRLPSVTAAEAAALVGPAFTIALLAAIESLLSAVVADGMIGGRHRSNMELVAQGVANIASPIFGGIPATGAIARTATNVKNGGRTPVAGMIHAATLLLITLFFGRWAALIPMAALAAILVMVAWHMGEWRTLRAELRAPLSDVAVLLTTFTLTVAVDLTVAIEVGMVLAAFLFMRRMAEVTDVRFATSEFQEEGENGNEAPPGGRRALPAGVEVYEINGPFFFGAAEKFKDTLERVARKPRVLIVRMRHVPAIDSTGLHALKELVRRGRGDGTLVLLSELRAQPLRALRRSGLVREMGRRSVCRTLDRAVTRAREHLGLPAVEPEPGAPEDALERP